MTEPGNAISLERMTDERVGVTPLASLSELHAALEGCKVAWGCLITPTEARLLHRPAAEWEELLATPHLLEARLFAADRDLHWLDGRGVALRVLGQTGDAPEVTLGGDGWWWRDRRVRLWGEHLEGHDVWYEERIPDPQVYEGLPAGPENRFPFLVMREYVRRGRVEYVRFLEVKGEAA